MTAPALTKYTVQQFIEFLQRFPPETILSFAQDGTGDLINRVNPTVYGPSGLRPYQHHTVQFVYNPDAFIAQHSKEEFLSQEENAAALAATVTGMGASCADSLDAVAWAAAYKPAQVLSILVPQPPM